MTRRMDWQDVRAMFEERSASLEFDGGLARADADAQAIREICETVTEGGILGELICADRRRRHPALVTVIIALGLMGRRCPAWGFGHVVFEGDETYRPALHGEAAYAAFIVPVTAADVDDVVELIDLVACIIPQRRMRSRRGIASVIGLDEIELAREADAPLYVFDDVAVWLKGGALGAVIVDWDRGIREIEGARALICSESLAPRLHEATRRCWPRPTISFIPKAMRHAA